MNAALAAVSLAQVVTDDLFIRADVVALGVERGPAVARLLAAVEEWWEAGDYRAGRKATLKKLAELAAK